MPEEWEQAGINTGGEPRMSFQRGMQQCAQDHGSEPARCWVAPPRAQALGDEEEVQGAVNRGEEKGWEDRIDGTGHCKGSRKDVEVLLRWALKRKVFHGSFMEAESRHGRGECRQSATTWAWPWRPKAGVCLRPTEKPGWPESQVMFRKIARYEEANEEEKV